MSMRNDTLVVLLLLSLTMYWSVRAAGQQAKEKSSGNRTAPSQGATKPAAAAAAEETGEPSDAAEKAAILNSPQWRRAMFEFNEWLSAQQVYDAKQVEQIKASFSTRVARSSAGELQFMLDDLNAKFQILDSKPAQEARAWLGRYLSVLADWKREEVLKELPNFATMTAAQLNQEIAKIERKRRLLAGEQAASARTRQAQVEAQLEATRAAQQAYIRRQSQARATYTSPYRAPTTSQPPFADRQVGPDMQFYSGNFGQFGIIFNPSSY